MLILGSSVEYDGNAIDQELLKGCHILEKELKRELLNPRETVRRRIEQFLNENDEDPLSGKKIGIIINDTDRPTPSYLVLEELLDSVPGIEKTVSRVYIATGTHRPSTEEDLGTLLGDTYDTLKTRVFVHDNSDREAHSSIGITERKTEVLVQGSLNEHDNIVIINSVEPHYFAGFTGGRKSIVPGLAAYETVEHNHSLALDPGSRALALKGNPVHEDLEEASDLFIKGRKHVSIQLVQGPGIELVDMFLGEIKESFQKAVELSREVFTIEIPHLYDIVLTFARPPMDSTLYQAQKAIENGKLALRKGGTIILAASCKEGIGRSAFWDLLTSHEDPGRVLQEIENGYRLGYHKAAKLVQLAMESNIYLVSRLDPDEVGKGFMTGFTDIEEALNEAKRKSGNNPSILVIPDGTVTVPQFRSDPKWQKMTE